MFHSVITREKWWTITFYFWVEKQKKEKHATCSRKKKKEKKRKGKDVSNYITSQTFIVCEDRIKGIREERLERIRNEGKIRIEEIYIYIYIYISAQIE